ncbi:ATP-binding protein [Streptomyces sp. NBC_01410]|uniref:ATP-binding protein n=1 Tax=Streptomyces sp. NBC_01410 TaxID=2903856 RepID=UPI003252513E
MATVSPPWAYTLQLPHDPRAPGIARSTLRAVLRAHCMAELTETAELLASELVTNAHRYAQGPCGLRLRAPEPHRLRLGVWDANPEIPPPFKGALSPPVAEAECGRGLHLVELCADSWGACPLPQGGKLLWVECVRGADCQWGDLL